MIVYAESNFVLELALSQEQHRSCAELLALAESRTIHLAIPAFSLVEPHETLHRRKKQRATLEQELNREFAQLARTATYAERISEFASVTALLVESAQVDVLQFQDVVSELLNHAEIIPLDAAILSAAVQFEAIHKLSAPDAIVYASVMAHLRRTTPKESCFVNRNAWDFDDPDIQAELKQQKCRLIPSFDDGLNYVMSCVKPNSEP